MGILRTFFARVPVGRLGMFLLLIASVAACSSGIGPEAPVFAVVRANDAHRLSQYLAEGGDPDLRNAAGDTLLYVASGAKGGPEVVRLLLLAGADPNLQSRQGRTALHTAAAWCNANTVSLLFEAHARTDIRNAEGKLPIEVICASPPQRRQEVMDMFLQERERGQGT